MKLIIYAALSESPSELASFRDITLFSTMFLGMDVLIDAETELRDSYYLWLRRHGCFDYIREILRLDEKESGISLSFIENRPKRIKIDRITCNNQKFVLSKIATFA